METKIFLSINNCNRQTADHFIATIVMSFVLLETARKGL